MENQPGDSFIKTLEEISKEAPHVNFRKFLGLYEAYHSLQKENESLKRELQHEQAITEGQLQTIEEQKRIIDAYNAWEKSLIHSHAHYTSGDEQQTNQELRRAIEKQSLTIVKGLQREEHLRQANEELRLKLLQNGSECSELPQV
uniref:Uncharacterized protein n=1 Tax=viral metagenome TaxID=1070528 RepID=A0A6C0H8R3_9ZZZZ